jgi:superfamily II DNA or RNA helicase
MEITKETYIIKGILTNYGYCIKKALYSQNSIETIRTYFNVKPIQLYENSKSDKDENSTFEVFYEDDVYIVIPKFLSNTTISANFIDEKKEKYKKIYFQIKKIHYTHKSVNFDFKGKLRNYQEEIIKSVLEKLNIKITNGKIENLTEEDINRAFGGIIELSVGMGKTLLAIYLAHLLKLKTLVVVNQEFLQNQWIDRFTKFTNAKIGKIQGKVVDIENKDVVIGMVQSISMKDYEESVFKDFGLVIYDEVHHYGSRVYSQALMKTAAKYTIGLTATLERSDGMVKIINWFVGDTLCKMNRDRNYRVLVKKINFRSSDKTFVEKKRWITGKIRPDHKTMVDNLLKNIERNKLIINMINNLKSRGRTIFVISELTKHLEILKNGVDALIKEANEQHIYNTYYYIGPTKAGEKKMAETDGNIIFATIQLASEALDISRLDTIILTNPIKVTLDKEDNSDEKNNNKIKKKRITQTIGRILRSETLSTLTDIPVVIDMCDIFSIYGKWAEKREEFYNKNNWYVQYFNWHDDKYLYRGKDNKNANPMNIMFDDIEDEEFIKNNLIIAEKNDNLVV